MFKKAAQMEKCVHSIHIHICIVYSEFVNALINSVVNLLIHSLIEKYRILSHIMRKYVCFHISIKDSDNVIVMQTVFVWFNGLKSRARTCKRTFSIAHNILNSQIQHSGILRITKAKTIERSL